MDTTWVTAFYEFGGEMQMSSMHLDKIPLFKSGVPLELRLRKSSDSSAPAGSVTEDGEFVLLLPYIQSEKEFYDLAYSYMYGIEPTIKEDIINFYGKTFS